MVSIGKQTITYIDSETKTSEQLKHVYVKQYYSNIGNASIENNTFIGTLKDGNNFKIIVHPSDLNDSRIDNYQIIITKQDGSVEMDYTYTNVVDINTTTFCKDYEIIFEGETISSSRVYITKTINTIKKYIVESNSIREYDIESILLDNINTILKPTITTFNVPVKISIEMKRFRGIKYLFRVLNFLRIQTNISKNFYPAIYNTTTFIPSSYYFRETNTLTSELTPSYLSKNSILCETKNNFILLSLQQQNKSIREIALENNNLCLVPSDNKMGFIVEFN